MNDPSAPSTFQQVAIEAAAFTVIGYVWQWARALKNVPNWASWLVMAAACAGGFLWATPEWQKNDWRTVGLMLYTFTLAARGAASTSREVKAAPKSDAL